MQNQGVYLSWILFKIRWEIESNSSMKRVTEEHPFWTGWMLNWIGRSYFIWTIWWNPQHKVNYLSLLHEAKHYQLLEAPGIYEITRTFGKNKFFFCPWKWIPAEADNSWYRPREIINLFNFGIKNISKNEKKKNQSNYLKPRQSVEI